MIYEVEVSEQSESDLRGIFEYIAFKLQSLERYQKYVEVQFKKSAFMHLTGVASNLKSEDFYPMRHKNT